MELKPQQKARQFRQKDSTKLPEIAFITSRGAAAMSTDDSSISNTSLNTLAHPSEQIVSKFTGCSVNESIPPHGPFMSAILHSARSNGWLSTAGQFNVIEREGSAESPYRSKYSVDSAVLPTTKDEANTRFIRKKFPDVWLDCIV